MHTVHILPVLLALATGCVAVEPASKAPDTFTDSRGLTHRPTQVDFAKAHVLFFVLADCPLSKSYSEEINAIARAHTGHDATDVKCFLVHEDADITPEAARKHAADFGITMPVLLDREQRLARSVGATVAPSAAIVLPGGKVAYCGRIDDLYADYGKRRVKAAHHDLRDALAAVLTGKPVAEPRTKAVGCYIAGAR